VDLEQAMQSVVDRLEAGGVRAYVDARDANPPCVLLRPPSLAYRFGKGGWDASWTAWVLVPDAGRSQVLKTFGPLLDDVQAALGYAVVEARPDDTTMPDGSTLPLYALTWTERITP
jgi:hypothetical protein